MLDTAENINIIYNLFQRYFPTASLSNFSCTIICVIRNT